MFKFEELCELIRLVGESGVASVEIEHAGGRLRIDGAAPIAASVATAATAPAQATDPAPAAPKADNPAGPAASAAGDDEADLHYVTSPIVGTFYRAPNPDVEPYVKVGDTVESGHTLCIVEAMKLMNEIESDVAGAIVKVFPENAQPVEYGERLFAIRAS